MTIFFLRKMILVPQFEERLLIFVFGKVDL